METSVIFIQMSAPSTVPTRWGLQKNGNAPFHQRTARSSAGVPTRWGLQKNGNICAVVLMFGYYGGPHSLGTPKEWKPAETLSPYEFQPVSPLAGDSKRMETSRQDWCGLTLESPHSLGTPKEWKLKRGFLPWCFAFPSPHSLGTPKEWKPLSRPLSIRTNL